jgi:predicted ribosome quality control (RQC) complex YloA/Tae2 family protein
MARLILDLKKSIEENASNYFEKAKKIKKKIKGAEEALQQSIKKLKDLERKKEKLEAEEKENKVVERNKEWYEKFRWFKSSDGFLVLGGRDATSNEIVIKKHTDKNDLVLHTDITGSPFFVIKSNAGKSKISGTTSGGNKKIPKSTIKEAADATVTFSRAFKLGIETTPTFAAKPEQLTKEAKPGEFVPKGGFVTKGKLEYIDNKINLTIGITKDRAIMSGPLEAIKKHCKKYIILKQGDEKVSSIAKKINYKLGKGLSLDEIIRALPAGTFSFQ